MKNLTALPYPGIQWCYKPCADLSPLHCLLQNFVEKRKCSLTKFMFQPFDDISFMLRVILSALRRSNFVYFVVCVWFNVYKKEKKLYSILLMWKNTISTRVFALRLHSGCMHFCCVYRPKTIFVTQPYEEITPISLEFFTPIQLSCLKRRFLL